MTVERVHSSPRSVNRAKASRTASGPSSQRTFKTSRSASLMFVRGESDMLASHPANVIRVDDVVSTVLMLSTYCKRVKLEMRESCAFIVVGCMDAKRNAPKARGTRDPNSERFRCIALRLHAAY